jgi:hypothetical protein
MILKSPTCISNFKKFFRGLYPRTIMIKGRDEKEGRGSERRGREKRGREKRGRERKGRKGRAGKGGEGMG